MLHYDMLTYHDVKGTVNVWLMEKKAMLKLPYYTQFFILDTSLAPLVIRQTVLIPRKLHIFSPWFIGFLKKCSKQKK